MLETDKPNSDVSAQPLEDVPVDWEALEDAFENNAPEVHSYLHLVTGDVLRVVNGIADPEMHARIASDPSYLRIEPVSSREQYRWMERFIPMVEEPVLRDQLAAAIDGKGAFRRFKDVLMSFAPERERWFAFRSERLRVFMEAWLTANGLQPVARAAARPDQVRPRGGALLVSQDPLSARRGRTTETLRRLVREVTEMLGARDLEKVLAFAEFLKARRAARVFTQRQDGPSGEQDSEPPELVEQTTQAPDPEGTEESSPSSRQRAAAPMK